MIHPSRDETATRLVVAVAGTPIRGNQRTPSAESGAKVWPLLYRCRGSARLVNQSTQNAVVVRDVPDSLGVRRRRQEVREYT